MDEHGYPESMDYAIDEELYSLRYICSLSEYLRSICFRGNPGIVVTRIPKRGDTAARMKETYFKRGGTAYIGQDKIGLFTLILEVGMNTCAELLAGQLEDTRHGMILFVVIKDVASPAGPMNLVTAVTCVVLAILLFFMLLGLPNSDSGARVLTIDTAPRQNLWGP
ncbi:hypothetical protein BX666DRAFT_2026220 [Dichotomocladium elegans]|nr:hypothetical protein BX666DRAFT_2026220 [Dichotomocladium elegans]